MSCSGKTKACSAGRATSRLAGDGVVPCGVVRQELCLSERTCILARAARKASCCDSVIGFCLSVRGGW